MVVQVNADNFEKEVIQSTVPVLVDFSADWCGPCQAMGPVVDKLSEAIAPQGRVCRLDIEEAAAIAMQYKVISVPTFMIFHHGQVVDTHIGTASQEELMQMF